MATPEEANHAARADANAHLGKVSEQMDELKTSHTDNGELGDAVGHAGNEVEKLERFRDEIKDEIDAIQTLINHNQLGPADRRLREMIRRIERVLSNAGNAILKKMQAAAKKFEAAKRGITEPAIPMDSAIGLAGAAAERGMAGRGPPKTAAAKA